MPVSYIPLLPRARSGDNVDRWQLASPSGRQRRHGVARAAIGESHFLPRVSRWRARAAPIFILHAGSAYGAKPKCCLVDSGVKGLSKMEAGPAMFWAEDRYRLRSRGNSRVNFGQAIPGARRRFRSRCSSILMAVSRRSSCQ